MVYKWAYGARYKGSAQSIGERLEAIRQENDGKLAPRDVVVDARRSDSPLHPMFEWDDRKAAFEYRLDQARGIIRHIVVVKDESTEPVRAFVSVKHDGDDDNAYTSIVVAMANPDLSTQVVAKAKAELESWKARYARYREMAKAVSAVEGALAALPESAQKERVAA